MPRNKISTTVYVERDQDAALRRIRNRTGIPTAVLIRDAIDIMIRRMDSDPNSVIANAETVVEDRRAEADADHRYVDVIVEELDILTVHARQLEQDLDESRRATRHYRDALLDLHGSIEALLKARADLRGEHRPEPEAP